MPFSSSPKHSIIESFSFWIVNWVVDFSLFLFLSYQINFINRLLSNSNWCSSVYRPCCCYWCPLLIPEYSQKCSFFWYLKHFIPVCALLFSDFISIHFYSLFSRVSFIDVNVNKVAFIWLSRASWINLNCTIYPSFCLHRIRSKIYSSSIKKKLRFFGWGRMRVYWRFLLKLELTLK